jgi:hypothetical protein
MKILSGKRPAPRRVLLYGVHGVGKSTWAAQAPGCIILNLEDGLNDIECNRTEHLTTFGAVIEAIQWLIANKHDYHTLAIDSLDWLEAMIHKEVADAAGKKSIAEIGYGVGYKQALGKWDTVIGFLDMLRSERRMGVICLAHAMVKRFESPEQDSYDRYQPALHDLASAMVQEWCDEVLFASYRVFVRKEDQGFNKERAIGLGGTERYIRTQETAAVIAKNRLGMPPEIEFTWAAYQACFTKPATHGNISGVVVDGSSKTKVGV